MRKDSAENLLGGNTCRRIKRGPGGGTRVILKVPAHSSPPLPQQRFPWPCNTGWVKPIRVKKTILVLLICRHIHGMGAGRQMPWRPTSWRRTAACSRRRRPESPSTCASSWVDSCLALGSLLGSRCTTPAPSHSLHRLMTPVQVSEASIQHVDLVKRSTTAETAFGTGQAAMCCQPVEEDTKTLFP